MASSIIFEIEKINDFSLKTGRYGTYIQIKNNNVSIPQDLKTKINKANINSNIVENLCKLKIMKEHTKKLINDCKTELEKVI